MAAAGTRGLSDCVLSGLLMRGRGGGRPLPFAPTLLDAELLRAADAAMTARIPLAVVVPASVTAAPVVLAASAAVAAALHRGRLNPQIGVASVRLADRDLYDELAFRTQRLVDLVPRAVVTAAGQPQVIGRSKLDAGGRVYLTGRVARLLPLLERLEGVIVAAGAATADELAAVLQQTGRRIPAVYLTGDPYDAGLDVVRSAGGVVWAWDAACLSALAGPAATPRRADAGAVFVAAQQLQATGAAVVDIVAPQPGTALDRALDTLWKAAGQLVGAAAVDPVGLRWAWTAFHAAASVPVRPDVYDRFAAANPYRMRLGTLVETARGYAEHAAGSSRDAWLRFADALTDALRAATEQPRTGQLVDWATARVEAGERAILLVRGTSAAAAVTAALTESPRTPLGWEQTVQVRTVTAAARGMVEPGVPLAVVGTLPRSRSGLLTSPPAPAVLQLTCGPLEGRRAVRQAVAARTRMAHLRTEAVTVSAAALGVTPGCRPVGTDPVAAVRVVDGGVVRAVDANEMASAEDTAWEPFAVHVTGVLRAVMAAAEDDLGTLAVREPTSTDSDVPAIAVHLDDPNGARVLWLPPNELVTRRRGPTLSRVAAKALQSGDVLLLVDRAARTYLRVALTEKLSERTEYAALRMLVDFWHARAAAARDSGLTQQQILDRMTGTTLTTAGAVGHWMRGTVDGPADSADVARFARAVNDDALLAEAERVAWALRTLHIVHRKLGAWLAGQVETAASRAKDSMVDADLGVHVADLLDVITEHPVADVDPAEQLVPASLVGVLASA
ncbi:DISARM anti-phage system protein DrmE domain-containing protein [Micromonospora echinofusca]|uniref:DISARM anti-phage system protein DrmE domain-containing protein n=1 Tax=Micromonospora echinofusca TaxID=47858 RepID=UPI0037196EEB